MIILKIVIFTLVIYSFSYFLGGRVIYAIGRSLKTPIPKNFTLRLFAGGVVIIFAGSLICGIFGMFGGLAKTGFALSLAILASLCAVLFMVERREHLKGYVDCEIDKIHVDRKDLIHLLVLVAVICLQIVLVINCTSREIEAIRNIDIATKVFESGKTVHGSWIMNLWGCVASVMGVHPLVLIYTYLPTVTIILYYIGYFEVMRVILEGSIPASIVSLVFVAMLNMWGYQSEIIAPFNLLISWFSWQCYLTGFLLPFIACIWIRVRRYKRAVRLIDNGSGSKKDTENIEELEEDYLEEWDMKKHKIINARNLAIAMGVMVATLVAVVFVLNNKINTLHASTANLQRDLDSRCAMYEFSTEDGKVQGYLIKGSDRSVSFIGGGDATNTDALMDFFDKNAAGQDIDNWYLYSEGDSDMGAYIRCVYERGLTVKNVYILDARDMVVQ